MIKGIGIDAVEIERFNNFHTYSYQRLSRIFSSHEIEYCLRNPHKSAERFAGRFAAKEALYKALTQAYGKPPSPFLTLCAHCSIILTPAPQFLVKWQPLQCASGSILATITHTKTTAIAQVIVQ